MEKRPIFQKTPGAAKPAHRSGEHVRLSRDEADTIALQALGFMVEDDDRISGFMGETGIAPDDLRNHATAPAILNAVLDYLTRDETLLLMFAANAGIRPELVTPALLILNGEADAGGAERPSKIMRRR
jgi:Protein of unknown function (DUF3572)